ncbi:7TM diverse intracellular signaling domain-containing protein [Hymenobacter sp. IS2118]|uniref:7TM diverse intracellular signaling domain-containing protein n=1 Tax=Hymenobacter sp. IS2118 TaxID=1505605 RepID=UPI00137723EA|nr:7TM diverse intracellular signaling domain-containing protein [Hymenobacter sp. IS2118]
MLWSLPAVATGPLALRDTACNYQLGRYCSILAVPRGDANKELTLAQVRRLEWANRFRPSPRDVPTVPGSNVDVWLRCELRNLAGPNTSWLLRSDQAYDAFLVGEDGQVRPLEQVRDTFLFARTHVVPDRRYNIRLPLPAGRPVTLYVHTRAGLMQFSIIEKDHLRQSVRLNDVGAAFYFATLLALLFYNLLLFFSVRDRSYLYYVLFVGSFGALQLVLMGYDTLLPALAPLRDLIEVTLMALTCIFSILTARAFLETARLVPRLDGALRVVMELAPLLVLLILIDGLGRLAGFFSYFLPLSTVAVLLTVGVAVLRAGFRPARYYLAGWVLLMSAIVLYFLRSLGVVPVSFWTENGVRIASALEVILISLGLADRINLARREKALAQAEALAVAREKEEVQSRANHDLRQAYDELQASLATTDHLQELDEVKTRFFTNISHELRTPLTLIISPLEQMLTEPAPRPEVAPMHRNARRLLHLITQLLDIARLEAGSMTLMAAPTDLARTVRATVDAFAPLAQDRHVVLDLSTAEPLPTEAPLYADADKLEQILYNLLSNALKFTPPGGRVGVAVRYVAGYATVTVRDTGIGIAPEELLRVFERFHQADAGRTRQRGGSGVGLALVRELAALHGGTATARSTVGEGSTFVVSLALGTAHLAGHDIGPALDAADEASARWLDAMTDELVAEAHEMPVADGPAEADPRPLVLIVDDNADLRDYLRQCLQANYRLLLAADGEQGLARAQAALPDLVLSDLMMPGMDGLELCRRLKTDERTSHIPVVVLTALTNEASRLRGFEHGADDYLTKPFRPAELLARVRNLIAGRQQLRQRFGREVTLQPRDISITSADEQFLNRALAVVENHLAEAEFSVEDFAAEMALSRMHLHRKLKALTDQSTAEFVRTLRLRRAAQLLASHAGSVADVAYATGFGNLSHFARCFREEFGQAPSAYATKGA